MFELIDNQWYVIANSYDGDFCCINGVQHQIDFDYQGVAYITRSDGQTCILTDSFSLLDIDNQY